MNIKKLFKSVKKEDIIVDDYSFKKITELYKLIKKGDIIVDNYHFNWKVIDIIYEKYHGYDNEIFDFMKKNGGIYASKLDLILYEITFKLPILKLQLLNLPKISTDANPFIVNVTWNDNLNSFDECKWIVNRVVGINHDYLRFIFNDINGDVSTKMCPVFVTKSNCDEKYKLDYIEILKDGLSKKMITDEIYNQRLEEIKHFSYSSLQYEK